MRSKIKALVAKTELNLSLNERLILKNKHARQKLLDEIQKLQVEISAIGNMITELNPAGEFDRPALLLILKRQAAFRRKISGLQMQIAQKNLKVKEVDKERENLTALKKALHKKIDKYQKLDSILRQRRRLKKLSLEEADTEEKLTWK